MGNYWTVQHGPLRGIALVSSGSRPSNTFEEGGVGGRTSPTYLYAGCHLIRVASQRAAQQPLGGLSTPPPPPSSRAAPLPLAQGMKGATAGFGIQRQTNGERKVMTNNHRPPLARPPPPHGEVADI